MKTKIWPLIYLLFPVLVFGQKGHKTKMILDKTYQIDSVFQPFFGIEQEAVKTIATIDEQTLKEPTDNLLSAELHAVRDPFLSASSYQFSALRFRPRGLDGNYNRLTVNGAPMQDLANGSGLWNHWQGLNALFKGDENYKSFLPGIYAQSGIGQSNNIEIRASKQRAGVQVNYGFSSRSFTHKFQFTASSAVSKKGWSFCFSGGGNTSTRFNIPGVWNNGLNLFIGIDKQFGKQLLSINFFAADFAITRQAYTLKESTELLGNPLYHPGWGYQSQQVRNAQVNTQLIPVGILTHEWRFNNQRFWQNSLSVSAGTKGSTALNWFHAPDPRPDYYRYLPSFQSSTQLQSQVAIAIQQDPNLQQINWNQLYAVNQLGQWLVQDANGIIGNDIRGKLARYFVEDRKTDLQRINLASSFHGKLSKSILFDLGGMASFQHSRHSKKMNDLLGADFFVNWNQFAEDEIPINGNAIQYDLQTPNRIIKNGDAFGYDYAIDHTQTEAWMAMQIPFRRVQWSLSAAAAYTQFWRTGYLQNGLFPDHSLGKSAMNQFFHSCFKLGWNWAINGKQTLFITASEQQLPPRSDDVFISPANRDAVQENLMNESVHAAEMGYILQSQKLKIQATIYAILSNNGMDLRSFYHDAYNSFVNYAISGIGQTHYGYEFGMDLRLNSNLNLQLAAANGRNYFNSRQWATITADNNAVELGRAMIYAKNYPAINSPQGAYSLSLNYRTNNQWFLRISTCYFDQQWMGWNPIRHTADALFPIDPLSEKGKQILELEQMPAINLCSVLLSHGFSWGIPRKLHLTYSLGINNLFNNQEILIAANEQLRFDFDNRDPHKFPPKYLHAMGRTFQFSMHWTL